MRSKDILINRPVLWEKATEIVLRLATEKFKASNGDFIEIRNAILLIRCSMW
jgi:hypothetical protein